MRQVSRAEQLRRLEIYERSASDNDAARQSGLTRSGWRLWRQRHGLAAKAFQAPLCESISPEEKQRRLAAWKHTFSLAEAARSLGMNESNYRYWAKSEGLVSQNLFSSMKADVDSSKDARYTRAYVEAHNDGQAAEILGIPKYAFGRWRRRRGLVPPSRQHRAWLKQRQGRD